MGTRGTAGFYVNGEKLLTYNHFDSYPEGLGSEFFSWLKEHLVQDKDDVVLSPEVLGPLSRLEQVDSQANPTPAQIARLGGKKYWQEVDTGVNWYAYLRKCQGDFTATIRSGYMIVNNDFALDSVFCEYGYVIDVDNGNFDVYRGFNKSETPTEGLWAGVRNPDTEKITRADGSVYEQKNWQPIVRLLSIPFAEVLATTPEEFVTKAEAAIEPYDTARRSKDED